MSLPYDLNSVDSIFSYAKRLKQSTLRKTLNQQNIQDFDSHSGPKSNKGRFGQKIEKYFFEYSINSSPEPDFPCGLDLKVTPLKLLRNGKYSPKERLVCNIIDFYQIVSEEWKTSSFLKKNNKILLIRYVDPHDDKISQLDYQIIDVSVHVLSDSPHFSQFHDDWNVIVEKIKKGKAHELSESDTKFLGACTKGATSASTRAQPFSSIPAMQRAFSFKTQYMKVLLGIDGGNLI